MMKSALILSMISFLFSNVSSGSRPANLLDSPNDDGYSGLVKVGSHKVHDLLPLRGHGHPGNRNVDLPVNQVPDHPRPTLAVLRSAEKRKCVELNFKN